MQVQRPSAQEFVRALLETVEDLPDDFVRRFEEVVAKEDVERSQAIRQLFEEFHREYESLHHGNSMAPARAGRRAAAVALDQLRAAGRAADGCQAAPRGHALTRRRPAAAARATGQRAVAV